MTEQTVPPVPPPAPGAADPAAVLAAVLARPEVLDFLRERHLATLTTLRADGSPHVVPVGVTVDPGDPGDPRDPVGPGDPGDPVDPGGGSRRPTAWVICSDGGVKVANIDRFPDGAPVAVCQVDRARWVTLEGRARIRREPDVVAGAAARYAARYQEPRPNPRRVAIEITLTRVIARVRPAP